MNSSWNKGDIIVITGHVYTRQPCCTYCAVRMFSSRVSFTGESQVNIEVPDNTHSRIETDVHSPCELGLLWLVAC